MKAEKTVYPLVLKDSAASNEYDLSALNLDLSALSACSCTVSVEVLAGDTTVNAAAEINMGA